MEAGDSFGFPSPALLTLCLCHGQLCYDYKFDFEDDQHKIPCHCGAVNCRKWMNWNAFLAVSAGGLSLGRSNSTCHLDFTDRRIFLFLFYDFLKTSFWEFWFPQPFRLKKHQEKANSSNFPEAAEVKQNYRMVQHFCFVSFSFFFLFVGGFVLLF